MLQTLIVFLLLLFFFFLNLNLEFFKYQRSAESKRVRTYSFLMGCLLKLFNN